MSFVYFSLIIYYLPLKHETRGGEGRGTTHMENLRCSGVIFHDNIENRDKNIAPILLIILELYSCHLAKILNKI